MGEVKIQQVTCPRHVLIKCSPQFKSTLMDCKKQLGGQVDPRGYKYFLANYMPDAFKAAKHKHRERVDQTYKENVGKPMKERTQI